MAQGRVRVKGFLAAVVVLGAGSPLGGGCEEACAAPYRPVGHQYTYPGGPPTGDWPVTGEARPRPVPVFDTDGDGTGDTWALTDDRRQLTIHRAAGDLVLTVPAPQVVVSYEGRTSLGDLDGDGRTETQVDVAADPTSSDVTHYVVPGTTPDGPHDLATVAAVPAATYLQAVGDVDGDGRDDLATGGFGTDSTQVWLGADLDLTPGAPPTPPSHVVPGMLNSTVYLDVATGRTALNLQAVDPMGTYLDIETTLWVPQGSLRFTTGGVGAGPVSPIGYVDIVDGDGTTWLVVWATGRGGRTEWAWDPADLCAGAGGSSGGGGGPAADLLALAGTGA